MMRLKTLLSTQLTLFTYILSIDPDLVKDQLNVESINTSRYMCTFTVHVSALCFVTKVVG